MNIKELLAKKAKLMEELRSNAISEERFAEIKGEVGRLNFQIEEARRDEEAEERAAAKQNAEEERIAAEQRAARVPSGVAPLIEDRAERNDEKIEERAKALHAGKSIKLEARAAVSSSSAASSTIASSEINPAFAQVSSLDEMVNVTDLAGSGAEAYKKPFLKTCTAGVIQTEGSAPGSTSEPTFGYATIDKIKITAYAEVTEEVEKLPPARYISEVERAVRTGFRMKLVDQIINGTGSSQMTGILHAGTSILQSSTLQTIGTIDEKTLDTIVYTYGGGEGVEGDATLILNKLTLLEFAKVKGADKRSAYDIRFDRGGLTGTINGIAFVCTSKLDAYATNLTAGKIYAIYGKLKGYELTYFSELEITKSTDYKFKEGVIAYKASAMVGGSPAAWDGFITVQRAAAG